MEKKDEKHQGTKTDDPDNGVIIRPFKAAIFKKFVKTERMEQL